MLCRIHLENFHFNTKTKTTWLCSSIQHQQYLNSLHRHTHQSQATMTIFTSFKLVFTHRELISFFLSSIVLILGSIQISFEDSVIYAYQSELQQSLPWPPTGPHYPNFTELNCVPDNITKSPARLILACAALVVVSGGVGLFHALAIFSVGIDERGNVVGQANRVLSDTEKWRLRFWTRATCFMSAISALTILGGCVFVFVKESRSSVFHGTGYRSPGQHFTHESWVCQLSQTYAGTVWVDDGLLKTCRKAVGTCSTYMLSCIANNL